MILGITGHRPKSLGCGYEIPNPTYERIYQKLLDKFTELKPEKIISGMALGVDQWAVSAAMELAIPFIAAVPFKGQDSRWPVRSRKIYEELLSSADRIVIIGELSPDNFADLMFLRNAWIIDNSTGLLAIWNGERKGGTFSAVNYAREKNDYPIHIINPRELAA
jgi:uncharacterized phage-like protein YoqJ